MLDRTLPGIKQLQHVVVLMMEIGRSIICLERCAA